MIACGGIEAENRMVRNRLPYNGDQRAVHAGQPTGGLRPAPIPIAVIAEGMAQLEAEQLFEAGERWPRRSLIGQHVLERRPVRGHRVLTPKTLIDMGLAQDLPPIRPELARQRTGSL